MRRFLIAVTAASLLAAPVLAQQAQVAQAEEKFTIDDLLRRGFDIVGMQYLTQSILFTLQRHQVAYLCDANLQGETKLCIRLK